MESKFKIAKKSYGIPVILSCLSLLLNCLIFSNGVQAAAPNTQLVGFGPYEVGFQYFELVDPTRPTRDIPMHCIHPTEDDVTSASLALIPQRPLPFPSHWSQWAPFINGRDVYEGVSVVPNQALLLYSHGLQSVGWVHLLESVIKASWGITQCTLTHFENNVAPLPPPPDFQENRNRDVKFAVDELLQGSLASVFQINPDHVFGGGFSLGGRTMEAITSDVPEFGMGRENRFKAIINNESTNDPDPDTLTPAQMTENPTDTLIFSQYCRGTQQDLYNLHGGAINPAPKKVMITLRGFTHPAVSIQNHVLHSQVCTAFVRVNGVPPNFLPPFLQHCGDPAALAIEEDNTRIFGRYTTAYLFTKMGKPSFKSLLTLGQFHQHEPRADFIPADLGPDDETVMAFCAEPGDFEGEGAPIIFSE